MFGSTQLGTLHTAIGMVAVALGYLSLFKPARSNRASRSRSTSVPQQQTRIKELHSAER